MRSPVLSSFLAALMLTLGASRTSPAAEQAGVSAAVRGVVELTREQIVGQQLASGETLYLQDAVESGAQSGMQILLLDQTTFTLGAESSIVIDEFVYDPQSGAGKVSAQVVKGAFRFVTGRIAEEQPEDVEIRLPAGTIGIRGTIVGGLADPVAKSSLVVLLGPGRESESTVKIGALQVCNVGKCVDIRRTNFATRIPGASLPPLPPFQISEAELAGLFGQLYAGAEPPASALPPVSAGPGGGGTGGPRPEIPEIPPVDEVEKKQPIVVDPEDREEEEPPSGGTMRMITDISELTSIITGSASYTQLGIPLFDPGGNLDGSYDFSALLDFGAQELRGNFADPFGGQETFFTNNVNSSTLGVQGEAGFSDVIPLTGSGPAQFGLQDGFFDEQVDGSLSITFFNEPGHLTGTPPETAASTLTLTGEDFSQNPSVIVDIIGGAETPRD